ncbi:aquaporin [Kovacikia minuta CCNUW1]|uniref:aquaporin n=1 Tax=Kovacikia minuta TaxID=2931930 RepID=UPI001CCB9AF7|nr:aquaporin [Kovacikia minuta]UBF29320.1 aquaporin [Kovacikia minuta CCNUW1]
MLRYLRQHYPEYLMEAWGLGMFMISAGVVTTLLEYPQSPLHQALPDAFVRRVINGIAMGLTVLGIVYSPWGKRSGAHINPAFSLTFLRLGKMKAWDAAFYVLFQFLGGLFGVLLVAILFNLSFTDPPVKYIVTIPGTWGVLIALVGELAIAFFTMTIVLYTNNHRKLAPLTGVFVCFLVMSYVIFESPLSGFGMNPARTVASALPSGIWTAIWIYLFAPIIGMLLAAEMYVRHRGIHRVTCAKMLNHRCTDTHCIHCGDRTEHALDILSDHQKLKNMGSKNT